MRSLAKYRFVSLGIVGVWLLVAATAQAEGWTMPNLNPFSSNKAAKLPADPKYKSSSWLPSWKSKPSSGPSVWQKTMAMPGDMVRGTTNTMNKLNPFKTTSKTTTSHHYMSGNTKPAESKSWMWKEEEKPQRPQTVSDWIALPRAE